MAVAMLSSQSALLARHPTAPLYQNIAALVKLEGFYLETEPCLVCNTPETPFTTSKLLSMKADVKFTERSILYKLHNNQLISRISLKIGEIKKTKMVRALSVHYNNKAVSSILELKNKPELWHKVGGCCLFHIYLLVFIFSFCSKIF